MPPIAPARPRCSPSAVSRRLPEIPEVLATAETLPGYEAVTWFGLFTTAGTLAIVAKINAEVRVIRN